MRKRLLTWIKTTYAGRLIRMSGEPYLTHLTAVADLAAPALPFGYEIGLCHDLLEDTGMSAAEFEAALIRLGYGSGDARFITSIVTELTDVYTKTAFPDFSKKERKAKEADRLAAISANAQTVKYADLIYNVQWTLANEPEKAQAYATHKLALLSRMDKGDLLLRSKAMAEMMRLTS